MNLLSMDKYIFKYSYYKPIRMDFSSDKIALVFKDLPGIGNFCLDLYSIFRE